MVQNSTLIRDFVFPLAIARKIGEKECEMVQFLGTAFLVGSQGYALTAAHVVDVAIPENCAIIAMFVSPETGCWTSQNAWIIDVHPTEDVAILKVSGDHSQKPGFFLSFEKQFSSFQYKLFGYPYANLYEKADEISDSGTVLGRPDMIYSEGHIRRRTSWELPNIRGTQLYELSQPVGSGCSGSPIFHIKGSQWHAVGIYIADKIEQVTYEAYNKDLEWGVQAIEFSGSLAYAVRIDALKGWAPQNLSKPIEEVI